MKLSDVDDQQLLRMNALHTTETIEFSAQAYEQISKQRSYHSPIRRIDSQRKIPDAMRIR